MKLHQVEGLDTAAVCRLAGLSLQTLDYWVRTGLVRASIRSSSGHRIPRLWSVKDAVLVRAIKALRDAGCPLQRIRFAKKVLDERWGETLSGHVLYWNGSDLLGIGRWGEVTSLFRKPGQQVLHVVALPIGTWRQESEHAARIWEFQARARRTRRAG